jgi:hypothetical protein
VCRCALVKQHVVFGGIHVFAQQHEECLREALGIIRGDLGSKAQPPLRHEEEADARIGVRDALNVVNESHSKEIPVFAADGELVEVIGRIISKNIDGFIHQSRRCKKDRQVAHDVRQSGFDFWR